jgi:hypothetical protein
MVRGQLSDTKDDMQRISVSSDLTQIEIKIQFELYAYAQHAQDDAMEHKASTQQSALEMGIVTGYVGATSWVFSGKRMCILLLGSRRRTSATDAGTDGCSCTRRYMAMAMRL